MGSAWRRCGQRSTEENHGEPAGAVKQKKRKRWFVPFNSFTYSFNLSWKLYLNCWKGLLSSERSSDLARCYTGVIEGSFRLQRLWKGPDLDAYRTNHEASLPTVVLSKERKEGAGRPTFIGLRKRFVNAMNWALSQRPCFWVAYDFVALQELIFDQQANFLCYIKILKSLWWAFGFKCLFPSETQKHFRYSLLMIS